MHQLVANVPHFEVGHHQHIGIACDGTSRRFLLSNGWNQRGIGLQFAVDTQVGGHGFGQSGGLNHLVYHFMAGTTLGRETQHGHTWVFKSRHATRRCSGAHGYLGQLSGIGHGRNGHIAHHHHAVFAILLLVGYEQHGTAYASNARFAFDDLQCGAKGFARCAECARHLSVGPVGFNEHATKVKIVLYQFASLCQGHALLLAKFGQQLGQLFAVGIVFGVDDGCLVDVYKSTSLCQFVNFRGIANENDVGDVVGQCSVGSTKCAFFASFGQNDALLVALGAFYDLV